MIDKLNMSEITSSQQRIGALDARGWTAESGARLKAAVREAKWQQEKLAQVAGIARSTLSSIFKGSHTPREATLNAICDVIGISPDDIIYSRHDEPFGPPDLSRPLAGDVRIGNHEYSIVKFYDVKASAGPGRFPLSENAAGGVAFTRHWLIRRGIAADLAGLVTVSGDSMAPTIVDGATVLIEFVSNAAREGIYVFSRAGEVYIKRIVPVDVGEDGRPRSLAVLSDNTEYPAEALIGPQMNEMRIIGRVRTVLMDH